MQQEMPQYTANTAPVKSYGLQKFTCRVRINLSGDSSGSELLSELDSTRNLLPGESYLSQRTDKGGVRLRVSGSLAYVMCFVRMAMNYGGNYA